MARSFFLSGFFAAVFCHLVLFTLVVFTMRGNAREYEVDLTFLGSILRKQDIAPQLFFASDRLPALEPSGLSGVEQRKAWELGVNVEKPILKTDKRLPPLPLKYMTERVEVSAPEVEGVFGIPEAPRIRLRDQP